MYSLVMVDDEEVVLDNIACSFDWEKMGFRLAATFTEALPTLDYLTKNPADLLITDIRMPVVSGLDFAQVVLEKSPRTLVVFLTAHKDFEYAHKGIDIGVFSYLLKPATYYDIQELCEKAKNALDHRRLEGGEPIFHGAVPVAYQKAVSDFLSRKDTDVKKLVSLFSRLSVDLAKAPAAIAEVTLDGLEDFLNDSWPYEKERLYAAINQLAVSDKMILIPISHAFDKSRYLAILKAPKEESFPAAIQAFKAVLTQNCLEILNLATIVRFGPIADGIEEIMKNETRITRASSDTQALLRLIQDGKTEKALEKARFVLSESADDPAYRNFYAAGLCDCLSGCMSFEDLIKYSVYPANIAFPLRLNEKNIPVSIELMVKNLPNTVKNAAVYFKGKNASGNDDDLIESAKSYVGKHYMENLTLTEVADHVYLSEYYFCRYFKKKTGMNFVDYLNRVRIERAQALLSGTNLKTAEICARTGYISIKYFHKKFKELTGATPREYRSASKIIG
ncbi:MAG: helix-turn-helix domain-containing protein [Firmicutes bacterium]|nr:helix-turn-helix domain-containing protein [Bacillota bacterium]